MPGEDVGGRDGRTVIVAGPEGIKAGEEILISYLGDEDEEGEGGEEERREERRRALREYGIGECGCVRCVGA